MVPGGCLEGVWRVAGGCLEGIWRVSGGCLEDAWEVSEPKMICYYKIFEVQTYYGSKNLGEEQKFGPKKLKIKLFTKAKLSLCSINVTLMLHYIMNVDEGW